MLDSIGFRMNVMSRVLCETGMSVIFAVLRMADVHAFVYTCLHLLCDIATVVRELASGEQVSHQLFRHILLTLYRRFKVFETFC